MTRGGGTKAQRAEARRRAALSAAVLAENWTDRNGKARPTPERRRRGAFVLQDGDEAGVTVAVDGAATLLDRLRMAKLISDVQCRAGLDLAALFDRTRQGTQMRSCLDFTPVGFDPEREPTHGELRDIAERAQLHRIIGAAPWALMRAVCLEQRGPRDLRHLRGLRIGLDKVVDFWRLA